MQTDQPCESKLSAKRVQRKCNKGVEFEGHRRKDDELYPAVIAPP